jgi:cytochrome c-type biogenesis protein CcmH/NrfG
MRNLCVLLLLLIGVRPLDSEQTKGSDPEWSQMTARLERAALDGVTKDLRAIRSELQGRVASAGADEAMVRYTLAYTSYRMVNLPDVPDKDRTDLLNDAVTQLQQVIKRNSKDAEAHALLGSVYGLQIAQSPVIRGMTLGPRANSALDRAAEIESGNPRVLLLQGVSAFNTPAMFGGGTDKAEQHLRRSLERFAAEPSDKAWPNWGRFDAHVWLGQALLQKGDRTGAHAEYDKARALAPNSGWLRYVLIPALEAKK